MPRLVYAYMAFRKPWAIPAPSDKRVFGQYRSSPCQPSTFATGIKWRVAVWVGFCICVREVQGAFA